MLLFLQLDNAFLGLFPRITQGEYDAIFLDLGCNLFFFVFVFRDLSSGLASLSALKRFNPGQQRVDFRVLL